MEYVKSDKKDSPYVSVNTLIRPRNPRKYSGINQVVPYVTEDPGNSGHEINGKQGIETNKWESGVQSKHDGTKDVNKKIDDPPRTSEKPYTYSFFYTHTFTTEEARKQIIGNVLGGIVNFFTEFGKRTQRCINYTISWSNR